GVSRLLRGEVESWYPRRWHGPFPEQPAQVQTDTDGRFRITGLGRDRMVSLALDGPAIRHSSLNAVTRLSTFDAKAAQVYGAVFDHKASPAQSIRGLVSDKETGKPL